MTVEEIKELYSMHDILISYGLRADKKNFLCCPFHKEKTPSMKVDKNGFYCFGCGENGDIFTFIQRMDGLSFKEAFIKLGGSYEKASFESSLKIYKAEKNREMERKRKQKEQSRKELNALLISVYRKWLGRSEPLSDAWCDCYNALQLEIYRDIQKESG